MGRHIRALPRSLGFGLSAALGFATALSAQEGGLAATFGLSQRLEASNNLTLDPVSADATVSAETRLSFSLESQTRTEQLSFDATGLFRAVDGQDGQDTGLTDPSLAFSYARQGANSAFEATARLVRADIAFLRPLDDFVDDDGVIVLPGDLEDLEGTGIRFDRALSLSLTLGQEGPFGTTLTAGVSDLSYDEASADLTDSTRADAGAVFRFALSDVTDATLGLTYSRFDEAGDDPRETRGIEAGLSYARPRGDYTLQLGATETEDGTRTSLRFGRALDLPSGALAVSIGVVQDSAGETALAGDLSFRRDLPRGAVTAALSREVQSDADDAEVLVTAISLGLDRQLTPLAGLSLDLGWVRSETTASDGVTDNATATAALNYALTPDWGLDVGTRLRLRDEPEAERATESAVFVTLGRNFSIRP